MTQTLADELPRNCVGRLTHHCDIFFTKYVLQTTYYLDSKHKNIKITLQNDKGLKTAVFQMLKQKGKKHKR